MWKGTKTWVAGPWRFSDANTYIRDNMVSARAMQVVARTQPLVGAQFFDTGSQYNFFNLLHQTPDEDVRLAAILKFTITNKTLVGSPTYFSLYLRDTTGATLYAYTYTLATTTTTIIMASTTVVENVMPGIAVYGNSFPGGTGIQVDLRLSTYVSPLV